MPEPRDTDLNVKVLAAIVVVAAALAIGAISLPPSRPSAGPDPVSETPTRPPVPALAPAADAVAAYQAAIDAGRPVYVLYRSDTCTSCVAIAAVARVIAPEYSGRVEFVEVDSDSPTAKELERQLPYPHVPYSIFIKPNGHIAGSFQGPLDGETMRQRLDGLLRASY